MNVLIVFATVEGQSRKIAEFAKRQVVNLGHIAQEVDVSQPLADVSFDGYDAVLFVAPVHERRHPKEFELLLSANRSQINSMKTLFLSVSLNAAFPEGHSEAREYIRETEMRTGFVPTQSKAIAGAINIGQYDFYATQVLRHVVLRDRDIDPAKDGYEFTDWEMLADEVRAFLEGTNS